MKLFTFFFSFILCTSMLYAQEWEQVSSLPEDFQTHHAFAFSIDGKGYIVTGSTFQGIRKDFYEYNPTTDQWTRLEDYPGPARSFAIGDVYEGKAYLGFGTGNNFDYRDLWVFDAATQEWEQLESCPCDSRTHPAMVTHNGKIYVGLGGSNTGNLKDWWAYDIATNTWEQKADFPSSRRHHPFQFAIGDYVYVGFGHGADIYNRWYQYDPANDTWQEVAPLPDQGRVAGTQFSHNGNGYILSGDGDNHSSMATGEFWKMDGETLQWEQLPAHPGKSRWAPSSFVIDGHAYIINGQTYNVITGEQYESEIFRYNLEAVTSIEESLYVKDKIKVYPNPTTSYLEFDFDDLTINAADFQIKIFNTSGQLVYQKDTFERQVNISQLPAGVYLVELLNDDKLYSQKVTKQ